LPGDGGALISRVAIADLGNLDDRARELSLGQLIGRHGAFGRTDLRTELPEHQVVSVIEDLDAALRSVGWDGPRLTAQTRLTSLDALGRAVALAGAAVVELPELLVLEVGALGFDFRAGELVARAVAAVQRLIRDDVTLVLTTGVAFDAAQLRELGREIEVIDLVRAKSSPASANLDSSARKELHR
jgi:RND superfamily putative drug exporter